MSFKIPRAIFFSLLAVTLFNFVYFYYSASLPDNAYYITGAGESLSIIPYYFFTFVTFFSFYTGAWFLFVTLAYSIRYWNKKSEYQLWNEFILNFSAICFFATLSYFFYPSLLGEGLSYLFNKNLNPYLSFLIAIVSLGTFLCSCFEWSYEKWKTSFNKVIDSISAKNEKISKTLQSLRISSKKIVQSPVSQITYQYAIKAKGEKQSKSPVESPFQPEKSIQKSIEEINEKSFEEDYMQEQPVRERKVGASFSTDELIQSLVSSQKSEIEGPDKNYFDEIIGCIEEKLSEFKISAKIINILKGPVVDTFELELGAGVKVSKVNGISEDLSLALSGAPIRIVYPMKGKTTVGIEVPRNPREIIYLDDVLNTNEFKSNHHRLPIAIGKDAFGNTSVVDLAGMPHMLVAGATGAGKSVFINTLLVSLLVKFNPEDLKLVLIDPKQLELALYAKLPHLIMPVITESKMASIALLWACQEMERRYSILKEMAVRNVEGFNKKIRYASKEELRKIQPFYDGDDDFHLPYLVIIVDEFADLILTKLGKDIETSICRLAAKARAAGIHLIIATQRPSVDVITGLIKSNFPTRVSFRVTSSIDSRTILNAIGAEKLLGMGDLLYKHGIDMSRLHSAYVDEEEIEALVKKMSVNEPEFNPDIIEFLENGESSAGSDTPMGFMSTGEDDELYDDAVKIVLELKAASASMLQRRLKVGYNRAANLIEVMEQRGIVGPQQGSKPRKVLGSSANLDA